jgi:dTMP kinase
VLSPSAMTAQRFITFEGGEGSGKSTQARLLAERLQAGGHEVVLTREPGGAPLAERIRQLVLEAKPAAPVAEFLLFAAARAEHIAVTIAPALARGAYVVCDRYIDSTRVYQGTLGKVDPQLIAAIERATVAPVLPSLTFILDVPAEAGLARAAARGALNRYDQNEIAWHRQLRAAFQAVAAAEPGRCRLIDGQRDAALVSVEIWQLVESAVPAVVR